MDTAQSQPTCGKLRIVAVLCIVALLSVVVSFRNGLPGPVRGVNSITPSEWIYKPTTGSTAAVSKPTEDGAEARHRWKSNRCHTTYKEVVDPAKNSSKTTMQCVGPTMNSNNVSMQYLNPSTQCVNLTKWVVMTTAAPKPTAAMKTLLNSIDDWCLLVLGEEEGPETYSIDNSRFIYLPAREQSRLSFEIVHNSLNSAFTRRNVGYLYAIKTGAKVILDLDDDAIPIPTSGNYLPIENQKQSYVTATVPGDDLSVLKHYLKVKSDATEPFTWNPYPYFGAKTAWPRGFPSNVKGFTGSATRTTSCYPIVQQFLIDRNPDVDPKYHLQNPQPLYFDAQQTNKVVLPRGVFAPYNAQATAHLYEAFWGLLLPKTLSQQVSDVWRSFIVQSLFYLIPDACLMFTPPAVYRDMHKQNGIVGRPLHDNASDFIQAVKYLPLQFASFEEAVYKLYSRLSEAGFLEKEDTEYMSTWINDLTSVGYEFPPIPDKSKLWTKNTQLCIMFNHASGEASVRLLLAYYLRFFNHIMLIFDGTWEKRPPYIPDYVKFSGCDSRHGIIQQRCLRICLDQSEPDVDGYLYLADDNFVDLVYMNSLPRSEAWFLQLTTNNYSNSQSFTRDRWVHWHGRYGYVPFKKVIDKLPQKWTNILIDNIGFPDRIHGHTISDLIYLPKSARQTMMDVILYIVNTAELHCEIAIPLAVDIAVPQRQVEFPLIGFIRESNRYNIQKFHEAINIHAPFLHPMKLSLKPMADLWCQLMGEQMKNFTMT